MYLFRGYFYISFTFLHRGEKESPCNLCFCKIIINPKILDVYLENSKF